MTRFVYANLTATDTLFNPRKGGLQILSWFTTNNVDINMNEETHPYVVNQFNSVTCKVRQIGGN